VSGAYGPERVRRIIATAKGLASAADSSATARIVNGVVEPEPYIPRVIDTPEPGDYPPSKPWLQPLDGESKEAHINRLYHTCYACGRYEEDMQVLDLHEAEHNGREG